MINNRDITLINSIDDDDNDETAVKQINQDYLKFKHVVCDFWHVQHSTNVTVSIATATRILGCITHH